MKSVQAFLAMLLSLVLANSPLFAMGSTVPPQIVYFGAQPQLIMAGESTQLAWSTKNAMYVRIDPGANLQNPSGSMIVKPSVTTTYTLTAISAGGTITAKTTVSVNVSSTIPVGYTIRNVSGQRVSAWFSVTEGSVNSQWTQPTLTSESTVSGAFKLPRASLYAGSAHVTSLDQFLPPIDCSAEYSITGSPSDLKGLTANVVISSVAANGPGCTVALSQQ